MLEKHYIVSKSKRWVKVLPKLIEGMNNTVNRSMKTTPANAETGGLPEHINEDRSKSYGVMKKHLSTKSTLKVGDRVRVIIRKTGKFEKQRRYWSEEVYIVTKVIHATVSRIITYKVSKDGVTNEKPSYNVTELLLVPPGSLSLEESTEHVEDGEEEPRSIYNQRELDELLINHQEVAVIRETRRPPEDSDGFFEVEKILSIRTFGKKKKALVKWLGYPLSEATWEPIKNVRAPQLLREYREAQKKKKKKKK